MKKLNKIMAAGLLGLMTSGVVFTGCQTGFGYTDEMMEMDETRGALDDVKGAIEFFSDPSKVGKKILSWGIGKFDDWFSKTDLYKECRGFFDVTDDFFNFIFGIDSKEEVAVQLKDIDGKLDQIIEALKDVKNGVDAANIALKDLTAQNVKDIIDTRVGTLVTLSTQLKITLGDIKQVSVDRRRQYVDPKVKAARVDEIIQKFFQQVISGNSVAATIEDLFQGISTKNNCVDKTYFDILKTYAEYKFPFVEQQKKYVDEMVAYDSVIVTQTLPLLLYHYQHFYNPEKTNSDSEAGLRVFRSMAEKYQKAIESYSFGLEVPEVEANEVALYADGKFYVCKKNPLKDLPANIEMAMLSDISESAFGNCYKVWGINKYDDKKGILTSKFNLNWFSTYERVTGRNPCWLKEKTGMTEDQFMDDTMFEAIRKQYPDLTIGEVLKHYFGDVITDDLNIITKSSTAEISWKDTRDMPDYQNSKVKVWKTSQKCSEGQQEASWGSRYMTIQFVKTAGAGK